MEYPKLRWDAPVVRHCALGKMVGCIWAAMRRMKRAARLEENAEKCKAWSRPAL
ncbi:hypothetical protein IG631_09334 [Alternaria alternata]|nr:hypothetical protein IG631_09334 [Alternaria alternata]